MDGWIAASPRLALGSFRREICQMYCQKFVSASVDDDDDDDNASWPPSLPPGFFFKGSTWIVQHFVSFRFVSPAFTVIVVAVIFWFYTV